MISTSIQLILISIHDQHIHLAVQRLVWGCWLADSKDIQTDSFDHHFSRWTRWM